jgi:hypothetical protein
VKLKSRLHIVPRFRNECFYTFTPSVCFHKMDRENVAYYLGFVFFLCFINTARGTRSVTCLATQGSVTVRIK